MFKNYELTLLDGTACGDSKASLDDNKIESIKLYNKDATNEFLITWELWDFLAFVNSDLNK